MSRPHHARHRAWLFAEPTVPRAGSGLAVSPRGGAAMIEGEASIRQAILLLLATRPGERVMRPDYGCGIHRLAFMPGDGTTAGLAIHYVRRALERWEPRVDVLDIDAEAIDGRLEIHLHYRVRATLRTDRLVVPLSLGAGDQP
jgi:phage baseplate assembly protein W